MAKSRGKKFEGEIYTMLKSHLSIAYAYHAADRAPGPRTRFIPSNPIDFLCYWLGGHGLAIECKATKTKNLPFSRFSDAQWSALDECDRGDVDTFVFVNAYGWPGRDGARGRAWAVPFSLLRSFRAETGRKSWPLALFEQCIELRKVGTGWEWGQP